MIDWFQGRGNNIRDPKGGLMADTPENRAVVALFLQNAKDLLKQKTP